jgi:hypothetical protein
MKDSEKNVIEHSDCDIQFKSNHQISFMVKARVYVYVEGFKIITNKRDCKGFVQHYITKAPFIQNNPTPWFTVFCVRLVVQIVGFYVATPCRLLLDTSICEQSIVCSFTSVHNINRQ